MKVFVEDWLAVGLWVERLATTSPRCVMAISSVRPAVEFDVRTVMAIVEPGEYIALSVKTSLMAGAAFAEKPKAQSRKLDASKRRIEIFMMPRV